MRLEIGRFELEFQYIGERVPDSLSWRPQIGRIWMFGEVIGRHVCCVGWSLGFVIRPKEWQRDQR